MRDKRFYGTNIGQPFGGFGNTTYSNGPQTNFSVYWTYRPVRKRTLRARKAYNILARVCAATGHVGECGLMVDKYRFPISFGGRRVAIPNPLYWMVTAIEEAAKHG
jgi:hypothetical protein